MKLLIVIIASMIVGAGLIGFMFPSSGSLNSGGISEHRYLALMSEIETLKAERGITPPKYRELWDLARGLAHRVNFLEEQANILH